MDIGSQNDTSIEEQVKENFIKDFVKDRYNFVYFNLVYGKENVDFWLSQPKVKQRIQETTKGLDEQDDYRVTQWNNFKTAATDVIAKMLRGDLGVKEQAQTARWIMSGESTYVEAKAKVLGERAGQFQGTSGKPNLTVIIGEDESAI